MCTDCGDSQWCATVACQCCFRSAWPPGVGGDVVPVPSFIFLATRSERAGKWRSKWGRVCRVGHALIVDLVVLSDFISSLFFFLAA